MTEFLVVYDYGMGGVWGFAIAETEAELSRSFPELQVVHEIPSWMTPELEAKIRSVSSFVVNQPATYPGWILSMVKDRPKPDSDEH